MGLSPPAPRAPKGSHASQATVQPPRLRRSGLGNPERRTDWADGIRKLILGGDSIIENDAARFSCLLEDEGQQRARAYTHIRE